MCNYLDVYSKSINKYEEELCGDTVEIVNYGDGVIVVLADGLGSGVKASILSTLTAKIAVTMMKAGEGIVETIDTIVNTLPICNKRKLAYSTFTIIDVKNNGEVYVAEYDNPAFFLIHNKINSKLIERKEVIINEKKVVESRFKLEENDSLIVVSDGVVHAGVETLLKFGWQWDNIDRYIHEITKIENHSKVICEKIINMSNRLYRNHPGDDSTAISIRMRRKKVVNIVTGPPKNINKDNWVVNRLMESKGKKVICGGTTANIFSRVLNESLMIDLDTITETIPPIASMDGVDLVTEGIITLINTAKLLRKYIKSEFDINKNRNKDLFSQKDAASVLLKLLIEDSTHVNFCVGNAINPSNFNPNLPVDLNSRLKVVNEIVELLGKLGVKCEVYYIND